MAEFYLLQYTDAHGRYLSQLPQDQNCRDKGLDRLSTYLEGLRSQGEEYLLIDNGDSIQGQPLVDLWEPPSSDNPLLAHPLNLLHQRLGVEIFIPGNHEFNFGLQRLQQIQQGSQAQWLSANILKGDAPLFQAQTLCHKNGIKVGVLGLVTEYVPKWEPSTALADLSFPNVLETARKWLPKLRDECDLLVVSYHGGLTHHPLTGEKISAFTKENQGLELLEEFPQIDVLFTGHQHRKIFAAPQDKALMIQPSCQGKCWAEVKVTSKPSIQVTGRIVEAADYEPDPSLVALMAPNLERNQGYLSRVLGRVPEDFQITDPMKEVWTQKHPFIQWVNNLMLEVTGADLAAHSLLDVEIVGLPPLVTMQDILTAYFFQDTVSLLALDGRCILDALEQIGSFFILAEGKQGLENLEVNPEWGELRIKSYNYDIFEGIDYRLDITRPIGQRLVQADYRGKPIQDQDQFKVALTTYRAGGGFFEMYGPEKIIQEFPCKITDLMAEDLQKKGRVQIEPIQNFHIITE